MDKHYHSCVLAVRCHYVGGKLLEALYPDRGQQAMHQAMEEALELGAQAFHGHAPLADVPQLFAEEEQLVARWEEGWRLASKPTVRRG